MSELGEGIPSTAPAPPTPPAPASDKTWPRTTRNIAVKLLISVIVGVIASVTWRIARLPHPWDAGLFGLSLGALSASTYCVVRDIRRSVTRARALREANRARGPVLLLGPLGGLGEAVKVIAAIAGSAFLVGLVPFFFARRERRQAREEPDSARRDELRTEDARLTKEIDALKASSSSEQEQHRREMASLEGRLRHTEAALRYTAQVLDIAVDRDPPTRWIESAVLGLVSVMAGWIGTFLWLANAG